MDWYALWRGVRFDPAWLASEQGVAVLSAAIAVFSLLANMAVVNRQTMMQRESLKAQMDQDMLSWAGEAIDALSQAIDVARGRGDVHDDGAARAHRHAAMGRLSAIADKGRLFFPNLAPNAKGAEKEGAFRGYRPPVLDCLIFAYYALERMDVRALGPDYETCAFLMRCRRTLVSEVQRAIDPRRRGDIMRKLALTGPQRDPQGFAEIASLASDLQKRFPGLLEEERNEAWVKAMARHARTTRTS